MNRSRLHTPLFGLSVTTAVAAGVVVAFLLSLGSSAVNASCAQIAVRWGEVERADLYELYRNGERVYRGEESRFTDSGLMPNTVYHYKVRAVNRAGAGPFSREVALRASDRCVPAEIRGLQGSPTPCGGAVTVWWHTAPGADLYELSRERDVIFRGSGVAFIDSDLRPDRVYSYSVRARNESGWGSPSTVRVRSSDICSPAAPEVPRSEPEAGTGTEGTALLSLASFPRDGMSVRSFRTRVISFSVEAKDSAMTIRRLDLYFDTDPRRYLEEISVRLGSASRQTVVLEQSDAVTRVRGGYRVRFQGLFFEVPQDRTRQLRVSVLRKHEFRQTPVELTVYLNNASLRMEDSLLLSHTLPRSGGGADGRFSRTFTVR